MTDEIEDLTQYPDRISGCYTGRTLLISGGTGFMGKVLVEKLLRTCSGVKKIYILVRPKKGKDPNERLREIYKGPLYDRVKKEQGEDVVKKVEAIPGDVTDIALGLSKEDRQKLIDEVEIIFHCAATVRFDEKLKKAVYLNVRGTKFMLELAKEIKNLQVFGHLSTAYCHLHERMLYEKAYDPPASPLHVIQTAEWMSEEVLDSITDKILGDIPNTYCFTKALGEALVNDEMDNLPVIIMRPSIVLPIWLEPIPGWTDNINGPTGLLIGAGKGVIRTMYCDANGYGDLLPVDIAVNGILACCYDYMAHKERRIYHLTSSAEYKLSWEEIINIGRDIVSTQMPLNGVAWYPGGSMKKSRFIHNLCVLFFHYLPAVFVDALLVVLGYKPVLLKVQQRISKGFEVFEYYANNQWDFNSDVSFAARDLLNPHERALYKLDGNGMNYKDYFYHCIHAARIYILKETDETLPAARRHMTVMWCVDKLCKTLFVLGMLYLLWTRLFKPLLGF